MWINLVATGRIEAHLRATQSTISIADVVLRELESGRGRGRQTAEKVSELIDLKIVAVRPLPITTPDVFVSLVSGPACDTLDDGEAATLASALAHKAGALIDERKATAMAAHRFPQLVVLSTTDILLSPQTRLELGEEIVADSVFSALQHARMRVPDRLLNEVCAMLGPERIVQCLSLPAKARSTPIAGERVGQ